MNLNDILCEISVFRHFMWKDYVYNLIIDIIFMNKHRNMDKNEVKNV
jgi:hypothetical protein